MFQDDGKALQEISADDQETVIQLLLKELELSAQKLEKPSKCTRNIKQKLPNRKANFPASKEEKSHTASASDSMTYEMVGVLSQRTKIHIAPSSGSGLSLFICQPSQQFYMFTNSIVERRSGHK